MKHDYTNPKHSPHKLSKRSRNFRSKFDYDKKWCYVYGLIDQYGNVGYVGQTRHDLKTRLKWHFKAAKKNQTPCHKWINSSAGVDIFMIDSNATWDVSEILWIERYRQKGHKLANVLRGGSDTIHAARRERAA